MEIWFQSIARAGGIEVPANARLFSAPPAKRPARSQRPRGRPGRIRQVLTALRQAARRFLCRLETGRRTRIAIRELRSLSDSTLRDIGLPRSEIRAVVKAMIAGSTSTAAPPNRRAEVLPFKRSLRPVKLSPCERAA